VTPWDALRAADPVVGRLLDQHGEPDLDGRPQRDHYAALVRAIVGQQLSVRAARAIHERFVGFFDGADPTPEQILEADPDAMREAAGLSRAKTAFLRSLAEHVLDGSLQLDRLDALGEDEIIAELTAVKGIGEWSAHMFLMFQLRRPDVLAVGDLGIRRAVERAYGLPDLPSAAEMIALAEPWRPHRTAACLLLWHSLDNVPK